MDLPFRFDKENRRLSARHDCALAVRWRSADGRELGYASNLSLRGLCLRSRRILKVGSTTRFVISRDAGDVTVEGTVAWVRQLQVESHVAAWHEMGIRVAEPVSEEYLDLVRGVESPPAERRRYRRFSHSLLVRITYQGSTFRARSVDISKSGVLFLCDELPPIDAEVDIEMHLPGTNQPVKLQGQVVRRVEDEPDSKVRGFAVRFLNLPKGEEQMFINYLKIARELRGVAASV